MKNEKKNQIMFVGGGETFADREDFYAFLRGCGPEWLEGRKSWKDWVAWALSEDWEVLKVSMPNSLWADYQAWKIWFEKYFAFLNDEKTVLVGNSLGGTFLTKYLAENQFPKSIAQLHLVAPVFDNEGLPVGEELGNFAFNADNLKNIPTQVKKMYLYHSTDDEVVPYAHAKKFIQALPDIEHIAFSDRGHFLQPAFAELLSRIQ